ncbi:MAG: hydrogenase expression/formation protein HypE [Actinobacteria bacterium]|nr:hydrogenase expression/formation protein HypE [Actinomycetota bacterium]
MSDDRVLLAHGGGGRLTKQLIEQVFLPALSNPALASLDDAALLKLEPGGWAFTTDTYVVSPLFFPGGDIGKLAVCGTINDLAVKGARPLWLSLGVVLEEGLLLADLRRVAESIGSLAKAEGVAIVTGDTKVVERGRCDGLYLNTAGIGRLATPLPLGPASIRPGDAVLVSGHLGDHGVAVLGRRTGISFSPEVSSDCAPLWGLVDAVLGTGGRIHAMRDLTRGGLAGALCDFAQSSGLGIRISEGKLPIRKAVRGACDLLGLDPLNVANEGNLVIFCPPGDTAGVLKAMKSHPYGASAAVIGEVCEEPGKTVLLVSNIGGERIVDMPVGEDLPRIC